MSATSQLIPGLRPYAQELLRLATYYEPGSRITSAFRSPEVQSALYDRWKSGRSRYPAAPPGRSLHNYGHAFDLSTPDPELQRWLGMVWESWGGRWGGRFDDPIHFDTGASIG